MGVHIFFLKHISDGCLCIAVCDGRAGLQHIRRPTNALSAAEELEKNIPAFTRTQWKCTDERSIATCYFYRGN